MAEVSSTSGEMACCVLWHPSDVEPPERLRDALARREIEIRGCQDPFRAMSEICVLARTPKVSALILLLIEAGRLHRAAGVIDAIESYVPHATCWTFDAASHPELREVSEADLDRWRRREHERASRQAAARPRLSGVVPGDDADSLEGGPRLKLVRHADANGADVSPQPAREIGGVGLDLGEAVRPVGAGDIGRDRAGSHVDGSGGKSDVEAERPPLLSDEELGMLLGPEAGPEADAERGPDGEQDPSRP